MQDAAAGVAPAPDHEPPGRAPNPVHRAGPAWPVFIPQEGEDHPSSAFSGLPLLHAWFQIPLDFTVSVKGFCSPLGSRDLRGVLARAYG